MNTCTSSLISEKAVFLPALGCLSYAGASQDKQMNSGPIETSYKGYKFRSRLEARWAVFFDTAKIDWQYEPQGFKSKGSMYLPDFYLPKSDTWVEVKGSDDQFNRDWPKMVDVLSGKSPVPGLQDSLGSTRGVAVLGPIPEDFFGLILHPIVQSRGAFGELHINWFSFGSGDECVLTIPPQRDILEFLLGIPEVIHLASQGDLSVIAKCIKTPSAIGPALEGYRAARTARFEHGRSGY